MRAIDADEAVKIAERSYDMWNMAMAAADTKREINLVYKRQELCKAVELVVKHCPTIEVEKRGAWVEDICCNDIVMCNACGNEAYFGLDEGTYVLFDYCPNCGAKMDAEVKQE